MLSWHLAYAVYTLCEYNVPCALTVYMYFPPHLLMCSGPCPLFLGPCHLSCLGSLVVERSVFCKTEFHWFSPTGATCCLRCLCVVSFCIVLPCLFFRLLCTCTPYTMYMMYIIYCSTLTSAKSHVSTPCMQNSLSTYETLGLYTEQLS